MIQTLLLSKPDLLVSLPGLLLCRGGTVHTFIALQALPAGGTGAPVGVWETEHMGLASLWSTTPFLTGSAKRVPFTSFLEEKKVIQSQTYNPLKCLILLFKGSLLDHWTWKTIQSQLRYGQGEHTFYIHINEDIRATSPILHSTHLGEGGIHITDIVDSLMYWNIPVFGNKKLLGKAPFSYSHKGAVCLAEAIELPFPALSTYKILDPMAPFSTHNLLIKYSSLTLLTRPPHKPRRANAFPRIFMADTIVHTSGAGTVTLRSPLLSLASFG